MSAPEHGLRMQADGAWTEARRGVARQLVLLAAGLTALLWWYRDTVMSLVDIWNRSDTFAHGFLIAPISCWLIWRNREHLRGLPVVPSMSGVVAGGVAGFAWLLGDLASVASVSQFALVGMIVALVWALTGTKVTRAIAFPLGFLFFLVPFGEFLFPTMMDLTTDFVIGGLRLSGVPVYAEGRSLVIPSGHWEVVEGCSGVRYLIASVVVGSLYAFLTYRSLHRRLIFVALSVVLPILANWLRAYGIVMLAHLSDNRLAAGVDHLIYGWVFFGIVMLGLFWVGGRWREDEPAAAQSGFVKAPLVPVTASRRFGMAGTAVLALAVVPVWKIVPEWLDAQQKQGAVVFSALPDIGGWVPAADRVPVWAPRYAGMRAESRSAWAAGDQAVGLYVAYYRNQGRGAELINSENRILLNKDPEWKMASYGTRQAMVGPEPVGVRSTEIFNGGNRLLVWNWYWVDGRWTSNDYVAKLYQVVSQLSGNGDAAAAVMVYSPIVGGRKEDAEAALEAFARDIGPGLGVFLQQATGH